MKASTAVVITILVGVVLAGIFWAVIVFSGWYSIAAHGDTGGPIEWSADRTASHSIAYHAKGIQVPPLNDPKLAREGAGEYHETCAECHGAPGKEPAEWARSMAPEPPEVKEIVEEFQPNEIFWIAKNGIRMTGMPSFHGESDQKLWGVVAFMEKLPKMTPAEYQQAVAAAPEQQGEHAEGGENGESGESPESH
ncbi:MAG: cytochrome c [Thermoanaerobaculia bacterium]